MASSAILNEFIWSERYRPQTIEETILPERFKVIFRNFVRDGNLPNLLCVGGAGIGKTTIVLAAIKELGANAMEKNGSLDSNLDILRTDILRFAATTSFNGKRKYVIIDEADGLDWRVQPALRNFMQEYSANCGFLMTANYPSKIIKPLKSRLTVVDFTIRKDERREMMREMYKRIVFILEAEGVTFDKNAVAELMKRHAPDWRKCIDELQRYAKQGDGKIDAGILALASDSFVDELFDIIKAKDFGALRKWVALNNDIEPHIVFRGLFDHMNKYLTIDSAAFLITTIADYQYKAAFVADQEINTLACLTMFIAEAEFK